MLTKTAFHKFALWEITAVIGDLLSIKTRMYIQSRRVTKAGVFVLVSRFQKELLLCSMWEKYFMKTVKLVKSVKKPIKILLALI